MVFFSVTDFCLKLYWHETCWHYRRRCYNERSTTYYSREHMYNRGVCIHHCSLSYCKRRNHIFFYDPSQFHQYGYQLFYKRHNNTAAYFMFFPAREKLSFKISSKQYMLFAFFQYLLCT